MIKYFLRTILLVVIFFVAFLVTTILLDTIDQCSGYYNEGRRDSAAVVDRHIVYLRNFL
jgi:hypothetical protein